MYDFHYNFIKKNFNAELLFTDTDSLVYEIKSENIYEEFFKWKYLFDFSNYSKHSILCDYTNKKIIGKMKYDYGGNIIDEFIGIKSKLYSIIKWVNIATEFNEFKDVLFNENIIRHKMKRNYEIDKKSLSCFDDKRYVLNDGVRTLVYFHKDSHKL